MDIFPNSSIVKKSIFHGDFDQIDQKSQNFIENFKIFFIFGPTEQNFARGFLHFSCKM